MKGSIDDKTFGGRLGLWALHLYKEVMSVLRGTTTQAHVVPSHAYWASSIFTLHVLALCHSYCPGRP